MARSLQTLLLASLVSAFFGCAVEHGDSTTTQEDPAEAAEAVTLASLYGTWNGDGGAFLTLTFTKEKAETLGGYLKGRRFDATIDTGVRCITTPCPSSIQASGVYKTTSGVKLTLASYDKPTREFGAVLGDYSMKLGGDVLTLTKSDKTIVETFHRAKAHTAKEIEAAAEAHAWPTRTAGELYRLFSTRSAAETWGNAHSSAHWLAHDGTAGTTSKFVSGIDDLWAEEFTVDDYSLAITVTGEH